MYNLNPNPNPNSNFQSIGPLVYRTFGLIDTFGLYVFGLSDVPSTIRESPVVRGLWQLQSLRGALIVKRKKKLFNEL